jgi:hypothetical protein
LIGAFCANAGAADLSGFLDACRDGPLKVPEIQHVYFPDDNLELLALRLSTGLYADEDIYRRLVRDIGSIRHADAHTRGVRYRPIDGGWAISVEFDRDTLQKINDTRYEDWNCLNSYLGAKIPDGPWNGPVNIWFPRLYDLSRVSELYSRLPGAIGVSRNMLLGDSSTIYVTRRRSDWVYVFDVAGGDCPAGCTSHDLRYFEVGARGKIRRRAHSRSVMAYAAPDWVRSYWRRYR